MDKQIKNFILCTRCYTYNQSDYILDAMNGFVMQKTTFPFVCVIVDDASIDKTPSLICHYLKDNFDFSHPDAYERKTNYANILYAPHKVNRNCFFAVVLLKENHQSQNKSKFPYIIEWRDTAKYNALCEGDDYWIDPMKLQKQVDYLESHPNVSFLFTARYVDDERRNIRIEQKYRIRNYTKDDILSGFNPGLQSICYKTEVQTDQGKYPTVNGDRILPYLASMIGEIHCLNDITAVYRVTGKGVSTSVKKEDWFMHATKDLFNFHQSVNNNDKKTFCVGMSRYVGSYIKIYPLYRILFLLPDLYKSIHSVNHNITFVDCVNICLIKAKIKLLRYFGMGDIRTKRIK